MTIPKTFIVQTVEQAVGDDDWMSLPEFIYKVHTRKAGTLQAAYENAYKEFGRGCSIVITLASSQRKRDKKKKRPTFPLKADQRTYQYVHKSRKKPGRKNYPPARKGHRRLRVVQRAEIRRHCRTLVPSLIEAPVGFRTMGNSTEGFLSSLKELVVQPLSPPITALPILNVIKTPIER